MSDEPIKENRSETEAEQDEAEPQVREASASLHARVEQLEQTVAELDDTAQAFKLLAEKQAAEINAKEILLARKTEYVDELLEQIKVLTSKLEAKTVETQVLESRILKVTAQADELREQVKKDEEDFAMVCAALDAREQTLVKKNQELTAATEAEKQLRKELDRHQGTIRRLEKNVEDLQPEKMDACLSPRSFHENQLIRLRDDAIEAKTREVWLLSGQNDQLRVQLDELEAALEQLQRNVISKENDLVRRQRKIDRLEAEIDALQVSRSQAEGREKAMEIATTQNEKLLQALEAQERTAEELRARLEDSERECDQLRSSHRDHIARSAESEVEVLHRTRQAEEKASAVNALQEKLRRERKLLQDELSSSQLNYQMEIEKVQSELVMRRNKQYDLTLKLQDVEARLHEAVDRRENAEEQLLAAQSRMQELERVLRDSLEWKKQLEMDISSHKESAAESTEKQAKLLAETTREVAVLQKQLQEMNAGLTRKLAQEKQQGLRHRETKHLLSTQEALTIEQKERIHRLVRDVNRESQARAAAELEKTLLKEQLETLRQQTESAIRECLEQKLQVQHKRQQLAEKLTELTAEFHTVQSAKSKLVCKFAEAFTKATSYAETVVWPVSDCLDMRECWLVDDDLRPLLKMLDAVGAGKLRRVDFRYNRITGEGMGHLVIFLKKLLLSLANVDSNRASGISEVDLRQNCISLDGIRAVAKGLETLISGQNSNNRTVANTLKSVAVTEDGRIEVFAAGIGSRNFAQDSTTFTDPVLVVDISANIDAHWLVVESRRFQAQYRRSTDGPSVGNNNHSYVGAAQLLSDVLFSRDKSLQEIYGLDLVSAFMGNEKPGLASSLRGSVAGTFRRKSASTDSPARVVPASPRAQLSLSSEAASALFVPAKRAGSASPRTGLQDREVADQLPAVGGPVKDSNSAARLSTSVSLPRLSG
ncbi:unnamed protein product [Phytophthora lilii]|uniref:Unnamed protein product n=1 Tax=Phytophthora lilii TaxID=2077276 RepID=A0A9W6U5P3_9STRA|nr:unnamed protein product [Phytophthora lilii]